MVDQFGWPGTFVSTVFRNASVGAMLFGTIGAARDEDNRTAGMMGFGLGVLAFITWSVVRVVERKLLMLE
jgi:hypothetical protein